MPTAAATFAFALVLGPTASPFPPPVSESTGRVSAPAEAAPPAGPVAAPPSAAPVAGPPTAAPVASPPTAAPPGTNALTAPPTQAPTTAKLPDAEGLRKVLADAKVRQESQRDLPEDSTDKVVTKTIVVKVPLHRSEPYPYDDAAYDDLYRDDRKEMRLSGYGGLTLHGSTIMNNPALWVGGRGGLIIGDYFSIGGAFYELSYRHGGPIVDPGGNELGIRAAYGGVQVGFGLMRRDRFSMSLEALVGAGKACISSRPGYRDDDWRCIESVKLFVTEPGISARFDVIEWLRLGLTAGYRFAAREAWRAPNDYQVSGPYVGLDVDFGWFE